MRFNSDLLATSLIIFLCGNMTMAAEGPGFKRPSLFCSTTAVSGPTENADVKASVDKVLQNQVRALAGQLKSKLRIKSDEAIATLEEAMLSNVAIREAVSSMVKDTNADKETLEIQRLRLDLMVALSSIDPYAANSTESGAIDLMTLITQVNSKGTSKKAKENLLTFLKEVNEKLSEGAEPSEVLQMVRDTLAIEKGLDIAIERISELAKADGVMTLFKGEDDVQLLKIQGAAGGPALEVRMTPRQAAELSDIAASMAEDMLELAKDPTATADHLTKKALAGLKRESADVNAYMKDNKLIERNTTGTEQTKGQQTEVAQNIEELLRQLEALDYLVKRPGAKGVIDWARRAAKGVPLLGKYIDDPIAAMKQAKDKINQIDLALVKGAYQLEQNNSTLNSLKSRALTQIRELELEIAKAYLISGYVTAIAEEVKTRGDTKTYEILATQVLPELQGELNAVLTLDSVLKAAVEAIDQVVKVNAGTIQQAERLRRIAIPAITVTESVKQAHRDAALMAERQKRIAAFMTKLMEDLPKQIADTNRIFVENAGTPTINPEVLAKVRLQLEEEREKFKQAMIEAGQRLAEGNKQLVEVVNNSRRTLEATQVGNAVSQRIRN